MDNPAFQRDEEAGRRKLARAHSVLTPTSKSWLLTQTSHPALCRCNSLLLPKHCCLDEAHTRWSDSLYECGDFQKFTNESSPKSIISTIYEPQFLASDLKYSGWNQSKHGGDVNDTRAELKKQWWPGGWRLHLANPHAVTSTQKLATILCALLLTLLASGNIIYILQTVQPTTLEQNKSTWIDVVLITGEFRIVNEQFRPSLANNTSEDFQNLGGLISQQLDSLFTTSTISEPYHSTSVTDFSPGLVVHLQMVLETSHTITSSRVGMAFLRGLYHRHDQVWLGNFSVDIQSIGFLATSDAIAWSSWSDWSACHFIADTGFVHTRARNCSLQSGRYLHSTLPCLLIHHSHGNIESAPCKPQEIVDLNSDYSVDENITETTESVVLNIETMLSIVDDDTVQYSNDADATVGLAGGDSTYDVTTLSSTELANEIHKKPCACASGEVCVALVDEPVPRCVTMVDPTDPTGCGGLCKLNVQICQRIKDNAFRCLDDSKCLEEEWQCGNQLCIPLEKRCDGHFNCYDHTDELDCDCLGTAQFTCNDSQCIPNHRFCDGFPDCRDQSDEPFGCGGECKRHEWKCSNTRCITKAGLCDGVDDCGDSSDEAVCPHVKRH